jgi:hypothetical protein
VRVTRDCVVVALATQPGEVVFDETFVALRPFRLLTLHGKRRFASGASKAICAHRFA